MRPPKRDIKSDILLRVRVLYALFIVLGLLIFVRLVWVQVFSVEIAHNAERLEGRIFQHQDIKAHRGSILTRDGEPLATSIFRYQVEMDFGSEGFDSLRIFKEQSDSLAELLSGYFKDRSKDQYKKLLLEQRNKHYKLKYLRDSIAHRSEGRWAQFWDRMWGEEFVTLKVYDTLRDHTPVSILPRDIDYTEWQTLRRFPILNWNMGMTYNLSQSDERVYPQNGLGGRIIGKLMGDKGRDYGLELVMSETLAGQDGKVKRQRIARGFYGRVVDDNNVDAVDGLDVVTTLDLDLMDVADKALRRQIIAQQAIWGTVVVMEVETGDILAMTNLGRDPSGNLSELRYNYAIGSRMEPGSTFKLAALLALLEEGEFPEDRIIDSGNGQPVAVGRASVKDSHVGYSEIDLRTAFEQSSNVYFATAVYETFKSDPNQYTNYLKSINLDKRVGFEAYGEPEPIFPTQDNKKLWTPHMTLPYMGFGYAAELTPLQTTTLYNAVANDGRMVAPRLVKETRRGDKVVERFDTKTLVSKICSSGTLKKVREMLVQVTESGTANSYLGGFDGMKVGAKTGTAQVSQGVSYGEGYYLGSLVGYMPADKPRYTVMCAVYTKSGPRRTYYGGGLAGPVVRDVMRYLYNRDQEWLAPIDTISGRNYPTRIKGGDIEAVRNVTSKLSPSTARTQSNRGWGVTRVEEDSKVSIEQIEEAHDVMPNVVGMGLKDAIFILENRGLKVSFEGSGRVTRQSIPHGKKISRGGYVSITLR